MKLLTLSTDVGCSLNGIFYQSAIQTKIRGNLNQFNQCKHMSLKKNKGFKTELTKKNLNHDIHLLKLFLTVICNL